METRSIIIMATITLVFIWKIAKFAYYKGKRSNDPEVERVEESLPWYHKFPEWVFEKSGRFFQFAVYVLAPAIIIPFFEIMTAGMWGHEMTPLVTGSSAFLTLIIYYWYEYFTISNKIKKEKQQMQVKKEKEAGA